MGANNISEALFALSKIGGWDISNIVIMNDNESGNAMCFNITCKYQENIIIPICAIKNNLSFLLSKDEVIYVVCADGTKCKVRHWKEVHICELEKDIEELYGVTSWEFIKRWYNFNKTMSSMSFIKMSLDKV